MFYHKSKNGVLITLLVIVLISRLILVAFSMDAGGDDGYRYLTTARNFVNYGVMSRFNEPNPAPTSHDMPLFILLFSLVIFLLGEKGGVYAIEILNALFFMLAAWGVYKVTAQLFREKLAGYIALGLFAILPENIAYSIAYMPESMFLALLIWAVFWLMKFWHERQKRFLVIAAIFLGLSVLTKGISSFFFAVGAVVILFIKDVSWKKKLGWVILFSVVAVATTFPWFLRNYRTFGSFSLSAITGSNLFYFYSITLEETVGKEKAAETISDLETKFSSAYGSQWRNPFVRSNVLGGVARNALLKDLPQYALTTLKRQSRIYIGTGTPQLLRLLGKNEYSASLNEWSAAPSLSSFFKLPLGVIAVQVSSWIVLGLFYLLVLSGYYLLIKKKMVFPAVVLCFGLFYFIVVTGPFSNTRYRVPMTLFLSPVAAFAISRLSDYRKKIDRLRLGDNDAENTANMFA